MSITYDFSGKTAVITGSARGIGRRIAERFYEAGANVALCSISPNGKEELMQEIAGDDRSRIVAKPVDMTQVDQIRAFFEVVVEKFGSFDILVNNAGITRDGLILDVAMVLSTARVRVKEMSGKDLPGGRSAITIRFEVKDVAELESVRTKLLNIRDVVGSRRGQN